MSEQVADVLAAHLRDFVGECICAPEYADRGLMDPDCLWCNVGGSEFVMAGAKKLAPLIAERERAAAEGAVTRLVNVHETYFDLDGEPGIDDTTPEPEDVWRYDRDFRVALAHAPTDDDVAGA